MDLKLAIKKYKLTHSKNENTILSLLENTDFSSVMDKFEISSKIAKLSDSGKVRLLKNPEFFKRYGIDILYIRRIVTSLADYHQKLEIIKLYEFNKDDFASIIATFPDDVIVKEVLNGKFQTLGLLNCLSSLSIDGLSDFIKNNREFLKENNISPYEITQILPRDKQQDIISKIDDMDLSYEDKAQILFTLKQDTKYYMDRSKLPPQYREIIEMSVSTEEVSEGKIVVYFYNNPEIYRGLDKFIYLNPMHIMDKDREKLQELFKICPNIEIRDDIGLGYSTVEEYKNAEKWIDEVFQGIKEEWTDIQKVAFIDNAIGKKISYSPDFDTEVFNDEASRSLWKIIDSGYGICNGIAQVEQYMLKRIGIKAYMVEGEKHAFLKLEDIELPSSDGKTVVTDTILDPTWNLSAHRFGFKPSNFCRSYADIRKNDIDVEGIDHKSHKNDIELEDITFGLDEKSLRAVYSSIGIVDENGYFPIKKFSSNMKELNNLELSKEESIRRRLSLLSEYCPEFATCQNSTAYILAHNVLKRESLNFNKCVVKRVYERADKNKKPLLYIYIDLPDIGKKFYYADKETRQFVELPQKEFEERFECYENDIKKEGGHRPWDDEYKANTITNSDQELDLIVANGGDGR